MSLFISFEGGEGSGKSTQAEMLVKRLKSLGFSTLFVHEPGTTQLGWYIRDWLKRGLIRETTISKHAELFLFAAARSELVTKIVEPAIAGKCDFVIADRYADSTTSYQGYGRNIPLRFINVVNELATQKLWPDITFLLDIPPEMGRERMGSFQLRFTDIESTYSGQRMERDAEGTRFEEESLVFHERVRGGYLKLAEQEPDRFRVIDATAPIDEIAEQIWSIVSEKLPGPSDAGPPELKLEFPA